MPARSDDDLELLKLEHKRLTSERDRIRDARAHFARQLGPLPAFAGISVALVAAFSEQTAHEELLWIALGVFALMVVGSIAYSRMPPYREIRDKCERRVIIRADTMPENSGAERQGYWYSFEIAVERAVYGETRKRERFWKSLRSFRKWTGWWLPLRKPDEDLQMQLDRERFGLFLAQTLFLVVVALLLIASLTAPKPAPCPEPKCQQGGDGPNAHVAPRLDQSHPRGT